MRPLWARSPSPAAFEAGGSFTSPAISGVSTATSSKHTSVTVGSCLSCIPTLSSRSRSPAASATTRRAATTSSRKYLIGQGLVGSTGDLWRRQRKLMAPFFTPRGVATYADLVIRDSLRFAVRWEDLADEGREVDLSEEMMLITASIILKAMFSSETPESITQMKSAVETMITYVDTQMVPFRLPTWVPSKRNHRYLEARDLVHGSIAALIAERRAIHETDWPNDLLSRLMEARDPDTGEAMTETLLRDESITMFFAGHETTARTMAAAWYALGTHPEVAARLHEELDSVLGDHAPTLEELHHLPYTLQVVKEVLRLYPAAPFYARDAIEDDQIGGFDIPSGATIMLSPFYTHRHPDFWNDPDRFDPDRWTPDAETSRHGHSYHPFAAGPRICIGNNFSLLESHLLLAILATLPPAPARWVPTALRHARHAEHRGRPTGRDRDAVIRCFEPDAALRRRDPASRPTLRGPMRYVTRSVANHVNDISKRTHTSRRHPRMVARLRAPAVAREMGYMCSPCRPDPSPRITLAPDLANSSIVDWQQAHEGGAEHMARRGGGKSLEDPRGGSSAGPSMWLNRGAGP